MRDVQKDYVSPDLLTAEEMNYVEENILEKHKKNWSDTEFNLFALWFYQSTAFEICLKMLMKTNAIKFKDEFIYLKAISKDDAREVIQEMLVKFVENKVFDPTKSKFISYFRRGIKYLLLTKQKKEIKFDFLYLDEVDDDGLDGWGKLDVSSEEINLSYENRLKLLESEYFLQEVLEKVPKNDKNVKAFLLSIVGYSYEEISIIEGIEIGNVKVRVNRGKRKLSEVYLNLFKSKPTSDSNHNKGDN